MSETKIKVIGFSEDSYGRDVGFLIGDFILSLNDHILENSQDLKNKISSLIGQSVQFRVLRSDVDLTINCEAKVLGILLVEIHDSIASGKSERSKVQKELLKGSSRSSTSMASRINLEIVDCNIEWIKSSKTTSFDESVGKFLFPYGDYFKIPCLEWNSIKSLELSGVENNNTIFKLNTTDNKYIVVKLSTDLYSEKFKSRKITASNANSHYVTIPNFKHWFVAGSLILLTFNGISKIGDNSGYDLTQADAVKICKAYIGEMFAKPTSIIQNYHNSGSTVYVKYTRQADSTEWKYACQFNSSKLVWAAWQNDSQSLGRWRFEDEVKITLDDADKTINFTMKDTNTSVTVQL